MPQPSAGDRTSPHFAVVEDVRTATGGSLYIGYISVHVPHGALSYANAGRQASLLSARGRRVLAAESACKAFLSFSFFFFRSVAAVCQLCILSFSSAHFT